MYPKGPFALCLAGLLAISSSLTIVTSAHAGNTGAFVGGMLTSRVLHNMSARTRAEQQQGVTRRGTLQAVGQGIGMAEAVQAAHNVRTCSQLSHRARISSGVSVTTSGPPAMGLMPFAASAVAST